MNVVPSTKELLLAPVNQSSKDSAAFTIQPGQKMKNAMISYGRKDGLIKSYMRKPLLVQAHEVLEEGSPTSGRCDDENRLPYLLLAKTREKKMVEDPAHGHDKPAKPEDSGKENDQSPPAEAKRLFKKCERLGFKEQIQVDVHWLQSQSIECCFQHFDLRRCIVRNVNEREFFNTPGSASKVPYS